jgi:formate hydrogenlyase subunit 3/multisubunit Na+/H+ antiporter MnhD subunit
VIKYLKGICIFLGFASVFLLMGACGNIDSKVIIVKADLLLFAGCITILALMLICYVALEKIEEKEDKHYVR